LAISNAEARKASVIGYALAWTVNMCRKVLWLILTLRFIQKFVSMPALYISNVVVYERP
jgi:hypothetical protein